VNVVIYGEGDLCVVERWDYSAAEAAFARVQVHHLPLDRSPS
jgi:hypothetical protein